MSACGSWPGAKKEKEDYQLASAYIITWDSNDWTSSFTINKGSGSGIAEDMVAITAQGEVVGLVTAVAPTGPQSPRCWTLPWR